MTKKEWERQLRQESRLFEYGFSAAEAETLRKASGALRRWAERECNGEVEVDDSGKAFGVSPWSGSRWSVPNRETGALKRLGKLMQAHPGWDFYHQTDPRGVALYLYRHDQLTAGVGIDCCYSSIGFPVY